MTLSTGDRLGRYEILGTLGAGGMGEVSSRGRGGVRPDEEQSRGPT